MNGRVVPTQLHALVCKSLSHQKRQIMSNIFCVSLCPLFMTLTCALIGQVVQNLLTKMSGSPKDVLFCSNVTAQRADLNWPITDLSSSLLPVTNASVVPGARNPVTHVNFLQFLDVSSSGQTPTFSLTSIKPCVYHFGKRYKETKGSTYSPDPMIPDLASVLVSDATFQQQPNGGFFGSNAIGSLTKELMIGQMNEVFLVGVAPGVTDILGDGSYPRVEFENGSFSLTQKLVPDNGFISMSQASGLLETIEIRFYLHIDPRQEALTGFQKIPSFVKSVNSSIEMDHKIKDLLKAALRNVTAVDANVLLAPSPATRDILNFFSNASLSIIDLPFGGIVFTKLNRNDSQYEYSMHIGTDSKLEAVAAFPTKDLRRLLVQCQLSNAFLRGSSMRLSQAVITQSVRAFPILSSTAIVLPLGNVIGSILYPFGVSFLMPLFVVSLVKEKERKIVAMMKINGVKTWIYSLSQFATFLVIYCISALVFVISGFGFKLQVFLVTSPSVLFILFFVWGLTQISMSFLIASACRSSNMALSFSFLLVLSSVVASMSLNTLYPFDSALPGYFLAWPPFAFIRALAVINQASYISSYTLQKLSGSDQVLWCIYYLLIESLIMQLISAYLETIIPSPLGVTYPWHWPMTSFFPPNKVKPQSDKDSIDKRPSMASIDIELDNDEGSDVVQERQRVALSKDVLMKRCPLVIHELRKKYPGLDTACKQQREIKMALNGISFAVEQGVVFGLLGPNGAGKSTLMSILTRVNKPTSGGAWIDGFSLDQIDEVQTRIGLCPQDDILWDDLTVFEHLLFYSRLKGVSNTDQTQYVEKLMTDVKLKHLADRTTRHLSGGEKRRLSIAIALVGSSKLIFLDEPTTGLDPDVRRQIWAIMKEAKKGKTIILTTHSMEEADVCCNRIGIMLKGNLKCIGPHIRLKQMHGNGFRLSFAVLSSYDVLSARSLVEPILPDNRVLISSLNSHHIYEFLPEKGDVLKIMSVLEEKAATYGIIDWEITQTTLENLFMKLVAKDEAS